MKGRVQNGGSSVHSNQPSFKCAFGGHPGCMGFRRVKEPPFFWFNRAFLLGTTRPFLLIRASNSHMRDSKYGLRQVDFTGCIFNDSTRLGSDRQFLQNRLASYLVLSCDKSKPGNDRPAQRSYMLACFNWEAVLPSLPLALPPSLCLPPSFFLTFFQRRHIL